MQRTKSARQREQRRAAEQWAARVYARIVTEMEYPSVEAFAATKSRRSGDRQAAQTRGLACVILAEAGISKRAIGRVIGYENNFKGSSSTVYHHLEAFGTRDTDAATYAMVTGALLRSGVMQRATQAV